MATKADITNFFEPITNKIDGASYVCLNINPSNLTSGEVIQPYVTPQNRGGQPAMFVEIFGLQDFVEQYSTAYILPIASSTILGGIKVGSGLSIAGDGTLSTTAGGGTVTSVGGVTNRTTITGTPTVNPTVDIASTYIGQSSITTLGIIATGTWQGAIINQAYLGTGGGGSTKYLREDNTWQTVSAVASISSLTDATAAHTLSNVAYLQTWNWNLNGTSNNAFTIADTGTTGTGTLFTIGTAASSNVIPFAFGGRGVNLITATAVGVTTVRGNTAITTASTPILNLLGGTGSFVKMYQQGSSTNAGRIEIETQGVGGITFNANGTNVATTTITRTANDTIPVLTLSSTATSAATIFLNISNQASASSGIAYGVNSVIGNIGVAGSGVSVAIRGSATRSAVLPGTSHYGLKGETNITHNVTGSVGTITTYGVHGSTNGVTSTSASNISNNYAGYFIAQNTASGSSTANNYGGYFKASGGNGVNYAMQLDGGDIHITAATKIGTTTTQQIGFWGTTPVAQQTGGAATAGVVYTVTEQAMLQTLWNMARTTGLLS